MISSSSRSRVKPSVVYKARIERALTNRSPDWVSVEYTDTYYAPGEACQLSSSF